MLGRLGLLDPPDRSVDGFRILLRFQLVEVLGTDAPRRTRRQARFFRHRRPGSAVRFQVCYSPPMKETILKILR